MNNIWLMIVKFGLCTKHLRHSLNETAIEHNILLYDIRMTHVSSRSGTMYFLSIDSLLVGVYIKHAFDWAQLHSYWTELGQIDCK